MLDRRLGKVSNKRGPPDREAGVEALYKVRYAGFAAKHVHEHLRRDHGFAWDYTWTKTHLQACGLLTKAAAPADGRHDAAPGRTRHDWLAGHTPLDLVVTLEGATGAIASAILVEEEGTASRFLDLAETIERHGPFCSLDTDRGSHRVVTPAGGAVAKRCGRGGQGKSLPTPQQQKKRSSEFAIDGAVRPPISRSSDTASPDDRAPSRA